MSGVYDYDQIFCPICQEVTKHITGWESEQPNLIDIQCTACYGERAVSGYTYKEGNYQRLIQRQHHEQYRRYHSSHPSL